MLDAGVPRSVRCGRLEQDGAELRRQPGRELQRLDEARVVAQGTKRVAQIARSCERPARLTVTGATEIGHLVLAQQRLEQVNLRGAAALELVEPSILTLLVAVGDSLSRAVGVLGAWAVADVERVRPNVLHRRGVRVTREVAHRPYGRPDAGLARPTGQLEAHLEVATLVCRTVARVGLSRGNDGR